MQRCLFNVAQPKSSFRRYLKTCGNKKFFITELCNTAKEITLQKINIGTFESPRVFPFSIRTISIMNFKFNSPQKSACLFDDFLLQPLTLFLLSVWSPCDNICTLTWQSSQYVTPQSTDSQLLIKYSCKISSSEAETRSPSSQKNDLLMYWLCYMLIPLA